ncbi:hypothetical protein [Chelativorans sp. YIM 93263]|uniref:hypothetical protein n=1 Tax=Chelativorans sp. YIM 93263 TaxID=2906648 RepID=UPI00237806A9|nr:hypothetical protein [Chelativorans sp. YIM 93263]
MPHVSKLYFKTAIVFLIFGIGLGLQMSISGNHGIIGAHAHANLLGWVTMAIFGGYYALNPAKAETRFAMVQYGVYTLGVAVMTPALLFMLLGNPSLEPLVALASLVTFAGVLLFAFVVFTKDEVQRTGQMQSAM